MATIEEFQSRLKEVVNAKRLSGSKLEKLTEMSMKLMRNDTQLVSILYRTHKSLPASSKISSLYVFDALCRAARSQVVKKNLTGTVDSEKGNCATFLLKIDSVLDGLFQDILSSGIPEAKEKTKKILDIWTKASTFPVEVVTRLEKLGQTTAESSESGLKEQKEPAVAPKPVTDPRKQPTPPAATPTPPIAASTTPPTAEAAQAALLALLTSASGAGNPSNANQTLANAVMKQATPLPPAVQPAPPRAQLEQLQLALLQQLSKNNSSVGPSNFTGNPSQYQAWPTPAYPVPSTSQYPPRLNVPVENRNFPGTHSPSPVERGPYTYPGQGSRDPRSSKNEDTRHSHGRDDQYSSDWHRSGNTRGFRGGFRGRGRGEFRGHYERDRDREPPYRERGSAEHYERGLPPIRQRFDRRSQSPPPRRRDTQADYGSPPPDRSRATEKVALESGKDEFGRDIRSGSVESSGDPERAESPTTNGRRDDGDVAVSGTNVPDHLTAPQKDAILSVEPGTSQPNAMGLDAFDISTFDPTSTESWQALGQAFQATNGYVPSQEELLYLVMSSMDPMMGTGMEAMNGSEVTNTVGTNDLRDIPMTNGMRDSEGVSQWSVDASYTGMHSHRSDAVVLGLAANDRLDKETTTTNRVVDSLTTSEGPGGEPNTSGGRMQKVGDRWVFVRNTAQGGEN